MGRARILAVDDNAVNLSAIETALQEQYEVVPMIAAKRALKYLNCEKVDLILLDVKMPVMDGVEALEEMRKLENGKSVPVIFLTATKEDDVAEKGAELGICDYITKPFDGEDLRNRIAQVLESGICIS